MSSDNDICFMPAVEMAKQIRRKELSPKELMQALLRRIDRVEPKVNAFTLVLRNHALAAAQRAGDIVMQDGSLGLLHGLPFTVKDLAPTSGFRTAMGSLAYRSYVPTENAVVVDRLLEAGGVLLGKTSTPEFGGKGVTSSYLSGTTNNPWKNGYTAGGSSGGAAASVAAGMGPLAQGSDGGGSIRIPASCCGVVGLKPSFGRVPFIPEDPVFETTTHYGPITRTVADAALMLTAMAGPDDRDPFSMPEQGIDFLEPLADLSIKGIRVAYSPQLWTGPLDPEVKEFTERAAQIFEQSLEARVEVATPDLANVEETMMTIWVTALGRATKDLLLPRISHDQIDPFLLELLDKGSKLSAFDYYRSSVVARDVIYQRVASFFRDFHLLLTPTLAIPPFPHPGWHPGPSEIGGHNISPLLGWIYTYPFNLTGQPAISVPSGFTTQGLPVGLQIVGRRHQDVLVLRAAAAFEEASPWISFRPPIS